MDVDLVAESRRLEELLGVPPLIRLEAKRPLDRDWTKGPRRAASTWRRRLQRHEGNVGMLTGDGLVVVDVDLYVEGAEEALEELHRLRLPRHTVTGITGGGGRHLFYRSEVPVPSRPLDGFAGIDVKGEGGMVVVPPSIHPSSGRPYEWEFSWGPGEAEVAELPGELVELFSSGGHRSTGPMDERDEEAVNLLLEHFAGHHPHQRDGWVEVTRPGKEVRLGGSATVGAVGRGVVRVWSTHWPELPAGVYGLVELRKLAGVAGPRITVPGIQLPDGMRLWRLGDADRPTPELGADAYHGPLGEYLELLEGRTEAHPAPIAFSILAHLGMWLGRSLTYVAKRVRHHPNLWAVIVGPTSSGGKGVADGEARALLHQLDPLIVKRHTLTGFGSGQALVDAVKDTDDNSIEKCRLVSDQEMAGVFRVCLMHDSTLSETLRKAFDGLPLESRTRGHGQIVATNHHIGVFGAITADELVTMMDEGSIRNGLGNRFLYLWAELTARLPFGCEYDAVISGRIADTIAERVTAALSRVYEINEGTPAGDLWGPWYLARRNGVGRGAVQALTARHHAHAARLMILYAALDGAAELGPEHVRAAIAWCDYSLATTELVFGEGIVGRGRVLLEAIRAAGADGLDGTAQRDLFKRNLSGEQLERLRLDLEHAGLIHTIQVATGGRPRLVSLAVHRHTPTTKRPKPTKDPFGPLSSFGRSPFTSAEETP